MYIPKIQRCIPVAYDTNQVQSNWKTFTQKKNFNGTVMACTVAYMLVHNPLLFFSDHKSIFHFFKVGFLFEYFIFLIRHISFFSLF